MEQGFTLKEMSKELNTTWQSIRSWKDQFYQFVPMEIEGKQIHFKREAIEVFRFIQGARENGWDQHDIRNGLNSTFGQAQTTSSNIDHDKIEKMQKTIELLQEEMKKIRKKMREVEIAKRDQVLMDNLNEIKNERDKKKKGIWSKVMSFTL